MGTPVGSPSRKTDGRLEILEDDTVLALEEPVIRGQSECILVQKLFRRIANVP